MENRANLKIAKFLITISFKAPISLPPFKGSTLRGGFGTAFKKTVCPSFKKTCTDCVLRGKCVYSSIFESPVDHKSPLFKGMPFAPHPFIIEPPVDDKEKYNEGETLTFNLILFGKAIDHLVYFAHSFTKLGKIGLGNRRVKFDVVSVKDFYTNRELYFYDKSYLSDEFTVISAEDIVNGKDFINVNSLKINFLTPTRIKYNGKLADKIDFKTFWTNIYRRVNIICSIYGNLSNVENENRLYKLSENIKIIDNNLIWHDWQRYSNRQKRKMKLGGLVGTIFFSGPMDLFIPWIRLGQFLHIGKNTSFGLGKYKMEIL